MSKKISELTESAEPIESDVLPIVNNNETKKVTFAKIVNAIKTALNSVYASITHTHVKADITDLTIPTKTSELTNDSGFLSAETDPSVPSHVKNIKTTDISNWNGKSNFSGSYNDLTDKPTIPSAYTLPTASASTLGGVKVGAGLSISNGVLSATGGGTADSVDWSNIQNKPSTYTPSTHTHKKADITDFPTLSSVATSGSYNDLSNKPTIPTQTSQLTNNSNFISSTVVTAFWYGTQAQYDALGTYNETTLYLIKKE